ncbi:hypothetical protein [Halomonas dongshanensis]|uniref:Uncharacterized protein n=1 Tax=Halomonas dongshanensis TaxID=2890835 RepID=A0ABT2EE72_9GAMM|nr:hypothetical protein [Halomonas dongshanensis]MCS2609865.1 hypothetical protein [Halomonas dongshanensis]
MAICTASRRVNPSALPPAGGGSGDTACCTVEPPTPTEGSVVADGVDGMGKLTGSVVVDSSGVIAATGGGVAAGTEGLAVSSIAAVKLVLGSGEGRDAGSGCADATAGEGSAEGSVVVGITASLAGCVREMTGG